MTNQSIGVLPQGKIAYSAAVGEARAFAFNLFGRTGEEHPHQIKGETKWTN
jgi:hypothetical protein